MGMESRGTELEIRLDCAGETDTWFLRDLKTVILNVFLRLNELLGFGSYESRGGGQ